MPAPDIPRSRGGGIAIILLAIIFLLYAFYNPPLNPILVTFCILGVVTGIYAIIKYPWKEPSLTKIPQTVRQSGTMQLKAGEKILKKAVVGYETLGSGVLYLTNQRLFVEYFKFNLFTRSIEIPITEITNVERTSHRGRYGIEINTDVQVEFRHLGKPGIIVFSSTEGLLGPDWVRSADEWAFQIKKAAKFDAKKPVGSSVWDLI